MTTERWMAIDNAAEIPSPALLIYPDRVEENLRRMIKIAGDPARLRPHVKTHKLPQLVALQMANGIRKFKTATIAEAEMCAIASAPDVLLAYQPVGPNPDRFAALGQKYPDTRFSCIADHPDTVAALVSAARARAQTLTVLLDLDLGLHRTGIVPGPEATALYRQIAQTPELVAGGLHAYDGHLFDDDHARLVRRATECHAPLWAFRDALRAEGLPVPRIVAGGTPTFPLLAAHPEVELSAGTTLLWDFGQTTMSPDLNFQQAAMLLTRVISKPRDNRLCFDLGHKAVASESPHPRVQLVGLEDASFVMHSEEHLVVETRHAGEFPIGTVFYGIPRHICPTVALQSEVWVVRKGHAVETWPVVARARRITL